MFALFFRAVQNAVAYLWPAYLTYKALVYSDAKDKHKWMTYWCVLAWFSGTEFLFDILLFWLPFYGLGKIAFVAYLWHPKTRGAELLYQEFLVPYLRENEAKIDKTAASWTSWISVKSSEAKERALTALGRGAVVVLEKAQEIGTPRKNAEPRTPTDRIFQDRTLNEEQIYNKEATIDNKLN